MEEIIAKNLKLLRENSEYTQDQVASFLGISRSSYANYESGMRSVPLSVLESVANLFGVDLSVLFDADDDSVKSMLLCAFRADGLCKEDLQQVAEFKEIAMHYLKMNRLLGL